MKHQPVSDTEADAIELANARSLGGSIYCVQDVLNEYRRSAAPPLACGSRWRGGNGHPKTMKAVCDG